MKKFLKNKKRNKIIVISLCLIVLFLYITTFFTTYSDFVNRINSNSTTNLTGISGNIVTLDDVEADYYYYRGLNYTYNAEGSLPSLEDKNYYNDNNLAQLKITYSGVSVDGQDHGYVSISERQDTYIYYKTLPINNNGTASNLSDDYVEIELIDNPFTDRPTDKGFNGWVTTYQGAYIWLDMDIYVRYAKVPVTYTSGVPDTIEITFNASWVDAEVYYITSTNNMWSTAFNSLNDNGMVDFSTQVTQTEDVTLLYIQQTISNGTRYPTGAVNDRAAALTGTCGARNGCTYYIHPAENVYVAGTTYYAIGNNGRMAAHTVSTFNVNVSTIPANALVAGYYKKVTLARNSSLVGYYNANGEYQTSGTCTTTNGCTYYQLMQYYDSNNAVNVSDGTSIYGYLVTRDTNIIVMSANTNTTWTSTQSKPFTLTSVYNHTDYRNNTLWTVYTNGNGWLGGGSGITVNCYDDTVIENIKISYDNALTTSTGTPSTGTGNEGYLYGRYFNLKVGRGLTQINNYTNFDVILGGSNGTTGSSASPTRYRLMVESGYYNNMSLTNSGGNTSYLKGQAIYGNDYDRANSDNSKLNVAYSVSSSFGGTYELSNSNDYGFDSTFKSGTYGSNEGDAFAGIYAGSRASGTTNVRRMIKFDGGDVYVINGGPISSSTRSGINDTYIYMTGGTADMIFGGAGTTATYGNRILGITGGKVNYSIFGGSNGYTASSGDGTVNGSSYVYVGGNAVIGDTNLITGNNKLFGVEAGSVFGIGNGNTDYDTIGSNDNSNIIINDNAKINRNVYGGGNYSSVGVSSSGRTSTTNIKMLNGTVYGSVFGGGNNNGSGSETISSTVEVDVLGGQVIGGVYGGANQKGTLYGNTTVNIYDGTVHDVYGGGYGANTFVRDNVAVTIGEETVVNKPIITGNVYGGSAFGTVNATGTSARANDKTTIVTVNNGKVEGTLIDDEVVGGYVFGGAKGDANNTPYVKGIITVNINGGSINKVFGGFDEAGAPEGAGSGRGHYETYWVRVDATNEITTNDIYMIVNSGNAYAATYSGSNLARAAITVTNKGTTEEGDTYYEISGSGANENSWWTFGTASSIGRIRNVGDDSKYIALATNGSTIVNSGNASTTTVQAQNNSLWRIRRSAFITSYYLAYANNNFTVQTNTNNANMYIYRQISVFVEDPEEEQETMEEITPGEIPEFEDIEGRDYVYLTGGTIGSVFGGGNKTSLDITHVYLQGSEVGNLYGGSNQSGDVKTTFVNITSGTSENVFGGNNLGGSCYTTNVTMTDGSVTGSLYGGGNQVVTETTNVRVTDNSIVENVFGGGNAAGISNGTNVLIDDNIDITNVYGGSNQSGNVPITNIIVNSGDVTNIYGGNNAGGNVTDSYILIEDVNANTVFGGNNANGNTTTSHVTINGGSIDGAYGGNNLGGVCTTTNLTINSGDITDVFGGGYNTNATTTNVSIHGGTIDNTYGGSNSNGTVTNANVNVSGGEGTTTIGYIYGGNNLGGNTVNATVMVEEATVDYIYGGGNHAETSNTDVTVNATTVNHDVYGGGNLALVSQNTDVDIIGADITGNVYGGGNAAAVSGNTDLYVSGGEIDGSAYAGGNGQTAIVYGNTLVILDNDAHIGTHVFGGGNAAITGSDSTNNSTGTVNIVGADITGNVYGGANTSKIYGTSHVNIGYDAVGNDDLIKSDIHIGGTVFGGGEANASGSTEYDYSFISVTVGININIDGNGHDNFDIDGSIFGSGNASSSGGYSRIDISNYGTFDDYKENISIQRADVVTLDNSAIVLEGATDRVNEYSNVLFSLSRIDDLKLKNGSTLFMENGANLVQKFESLVDVSGSEELAEVTIDDENHTVTKNVDNRLYMYEGRNFNIATNQNVTSYGDVEGMTFFGMYKYDRNGRIETALYSPEYTYDSNPTSTDLYSFTSGSYVLGKHKTNHDIYTDGFYSNFVSEEDEGTLIVKYIDPTPEDLAYYMWVVGEAVVSYEMELIASKYLTLGATELPLINHAAPNSIFSIVGVNYDGLDSDVNLVSEYEIPRIASSSEIADKTIGLSLKNSTTGWATDGSTNFILDDYEPVTGTKTYNRENTTGVPAFVLYLYHSKNIGSTGSMGTITISMVVSTPIDDLNYDTERVNIVVTLSRALYNTNDYEATITNGKRYELFASSEVNITTKGSFSTYYSLYIPSETNPLLNGYHRVLVSDYVFPENTKITMIDKASMDVTNYYYYVVSSSDVAAAEREFDLYGEASYPLSKFIKMGSEDDDNIYSDAVANTEYYDTLGEYSQEEFIFIVDFFESGITTNIMDKSLLLELRNASENTVVNVLGASQANMHYSIYNEQSGIIDVEGVIDNEYMYPNTSEYMTVTTNYVADTVSGATIFDTTFENQKLGIKLTMYDSDGNQLTGADMLGISYTYNNVTYPVRTDGSTRINLASKVSNVMARIKVNVDSPFAPGDYKIHIESFGSYDGIYYGLISSDYDDVDLHVLNTSYGLTVNIFSDNMKFIDKDTGLNLSENNELRFDINCENNLNNPKIVLTMYRRNYDSSYSLEWDKVNLLDYTSNNYSTINGSNYDYVVVNYVQHYNTVTLPIKENLVSGTYKMVFSIYDGNVKIGDVHKYILIK